VDWRIGQGYDIHPLREGRRLVLGGVEIAHERGLDGHSDADVLLHAIADAVLGAAGLSDIGTYFPPSDERWRDVSSLDLLRRVTALAQEAGWHVVNVDATVIAERPRIAAHVTLMRGRGRRGRQGDDERETGRHWPRGGHRGPCRRIVEEGLMRNRQPFFTMWRFMRRTTDRGRPVVCHATAVAGFKRN